MSSENILITGGAGFIGSHIAEHHLNKGDHVWIVDNLSTGRKENVHPNQTRFSHADIRNWNELDEAVEWAHKIYHMAAIVGQRLVLSHPIDTLNNNNDGCEMLLQAISQFNLNCRIVIASSSSVYYHTNPDKDGSYHEEALLSFASGELLQETYPLSKLMNEMLLLSYVYEKGIHGVVARIFNTIGVNQRALYGMVVPNFVRQALQNQPITVFGSGKQSRSFSNALDTAEALDLLLSTPKSKGAIVNVGNDHEYTILQLAEIVKERTGSSSEIVFIPYEEAYGVEFIDVERRKPHLEKLKELTGFTPKWSLEETIDQIIAHEKKYLG